MFPSVSCPAVCVFLCVDLMRRYSYLYPSTSCWFCRGGGGMIVWLVVCLSVCLFVSELDASVSLPFPSISSWFVCSVCVCEVVGVFVSTPTFTPLLPSASVRWFNLSLTEIHRSPLLRAGPLLLRG